MIEDNVMFNLFFNSEIYYTNMQDDNYLLVEHIGSYYDDLSYIIHKDKKEIITTIKNMLGDNCYNPESFSFICSKRNQMNNLYFYLKEFRPWLSKPQAIRDTKDDLNLLFLNSKIINTRISLNATQTYVKEAIVNITTLFHYELPVYKKNRDKIVLDKNWYILLGDYFKYVAENNKYEKMRSILMYSDKGDYKLLIYKQL